MKTNAAPYQQHRHVTGNHINWMDKINGSQRSQDRRAQRLAERPGLHAGNIDRQAGLHAFVHLLSVLSSVQSSHRTFATTSSRVQQRELEERLIAADALHQQRTVRSVPGESDRNKVPEDSRQTRKNDRNARRPCEGSACVDSNTRSGPATQRRAQARQHEWGASPVPPSTSATSVARDLSEARPAGVSGQDHGVLPARPAPVPTSSMPTTTENQAFVALVDIIDSSGEVLEKEKYFYQITESEGGVISRKKLRPIEQFYKKIAQICPDIKKMGSDLLRTRLKQDLHMDLDPDHTYFMHFDWAMNDRNAMTGFCHGGKPEEERTLTECLFSNFPADAQDNPMAVDQQAGIYKVNSTVATEFNGTNDVKLRPSDFMKLIWDIDFYQVAEASLKSCRDHVVMQIINNVVSFSINLSESKSDLNADELSMLLKGVGYLSNDDGPAVYPFDINGMEATDMLVFEDQRRGNRVIYMPRAEKKFVAFDSEFDMRQWIINHCADDTHRNEIARHFSISDRQDKSFYSGVDSWLKSLENVADANKEIEKICMKKHPLKKDDALFYITGKQAQRDFTDLNKVIKANYEVRKEMWARFFDAGNSLIGNPLTQFISLGFHIDKVVNGDTVQERNRGWSQVGGDLANLALMAVLGGVTEGLKVDFDVTGEEFISDIKSDMSMFTKDKAFAFENMMPIARYSYRDVLFKTKVASTARGTSIKTSEGVLPRLADREFKISDDRLSLPNERGIMKVSAQDGSETGNAIRIGNKVYEIEEVNGLGNYVIGGKNGAEVFFDKDVYFEKLSGQETEINYIPCSRSKRSPGSTCMHLSEGVDAILQENAGKGLRASEIGNVIPEPKYPGIFRNTANNKLYVEHGETYFEIAFKNETGFSIYARTDGFFQRMKPMFTRKITDVFFSPRNGRHFLNTELERSMEALNLSRASAELYVAQDKYMAELTRDEIVALKGYGKTNFDAINDYMRNGMDENTRDSIFRNDAITEINEIRSALSKIPPYEGRVFRGSSMKKSVFDQISEGDIIKNKAFLSTSVDQGIARKFVHSPWPGRKPMLFEIHVRKTGHPISHFTMKLYEGEVLINDASHFRVLKKSDGFIRLEEVEQPRGDVNEDLFTWFDA